MSNSIKDALKKLYYKMTGKKTNKESIQDVIDEIANSYEVGKTYTGIEGILVNNETNQISLNTPKYRYTILCSITFYTNQGYGNLYTSVLFNYESNILYNNANELFNKVKVRYLDTYEWKFGDAEFSAIGTGYWCESFNNNKYKMRKYLTTLIKFQTKSQAQPYKAPVVLQGIDMYGDNIVETADGNVDAEPRYFRTGDRRTSDTNYEDARIIEINLVKVETLH